jgi:hypothetical protein
VGDRAPHRAAAALATDHVTSRTPRLVAATKEGNRPSIRCRARLGTGPRWGTPELRLEASFVLMPEVRQGPAPDGNRKGGNQPAHQSMSTDVQRARLLPCTTSPIFCTTARRGMKFCGLSP